MASPSPHYRGKESLKFTKDGMGMMKIAAKELSIIWGKDDRYWKISNNPNEPAVLQQVSWLEVTGCIDGTDLEKEYEVGFELSFTEDAFGWNKYPVFLMIKRGDQEAKWTKKLLNEDKNHVKIIKGSAERGNGVDNKIYFGLYEVWSGYWKGGLKIHNAFVQEIKKI